MTSKTTPSKRVKNLKTLLEDSLITIDDPCHFIYSNTRYECSIKLDKDKPLFHSIVNGVEINEAASSTFIRVYLGLTTPVEGNSLMYINNKRISDYVLLDKNNNVNDITDSLSNLNLTTPTKSIGNNNNNSSPSRLTDGGLFNDSSFIPLSVLPPKKSAPSKSTEAAATKIRFIKQDQPIHLEYEGAIEPARIKPSGIGRYFHFNCDRYLAFSTREKKNDSKQKAILSPIQQAMIDGGFEWEEKVAKNLSGTVHLPKEGANAIPCQDTIELLKSASDCFIFQSTLEPPTTLRKALPSSIEFSISIPDFLKIDTIKVDNDTNGDGSKKSYRRLKILDAKSTASIMFSQKVQLAFYYLMLKDIIELVHIKDLQLDEKASIYLKGNDEPVDFELLPTVRILETFLYGDKNNQSQLVQILSQPKEDADWRLTERCDGCEYLDHCKNQTIKEQSLNLLPKPLSPKIYSLLEKGRLETPDKSDLEILHSIAINNDKIDDSQQRIELLSLLPYLSILVNNNNSNVVNENNIITTNYRDISLCSQQDHEIYILLIQNPINQQLFSYSILHVNNKDKTQLYYNGDKFSQFVKQLSEIFNNYNKSKESLQCFIYDHFERSYLFGQLSRHLKDDPTNKDTLTVLLTLLHSSEWINFNIGGVFPIEIPGNLIPAHNPLIVLQEQVSKSIATGIFPILSLGLVVQKLLSLPSIPDCLDNDYLYVKMIVPNDKDLIIKELENRLLYIKSIKDTLVNIIFKDSSPKPASQFKIRDTYSFNNSLLNKLKYCHQHDLLAGCKEIQSSRSRPVDLNVLDGKYLIVKHIGSGDLHVFESVIYISHFSGFRKLFEDSFTKMILVENTKEGQHSLEIFNDLYFSTKTLPKGTFPADKILMNFKSEIEGSQHQCLVQITLDSKDSTFQPGKEYILSQRFDINFFAQFHPLNKGYESADNQGEKSPMLDLFKDPIKWTNPITHDNDFIKVIEHTTEAFQSIRDQNKDLRLSLTSSQLDIVKSIIQRRLQLVVGPPGTGKTHFLALMVLIIMESLIRMQKKPYIIAITAHTHTAIDNLLIRIAELKKEYESFVGSSLNFHIVKKESSKLSPNLTNLGIVKYDKKNSYNLMCIGSTCWGLNTLGLNLDMLIIDEASQLTTSLAALGLNAINLEQSRVVVVGDPKQLGPVLKANFTVRKDLSANNNNREPKFHKSIFSCLKGQLIDRGLKTPYVSLRENFRMTDNICKFFSDNLYGKSYQSFLSKKEIVKNEALNLPRYKDNDLIQSIFGNPELGCHTILLDNQYFGNREIESEIVKQIYNFTKDCYFKPNLSNDENEEMIWSSRLLGIVTPMNIQRVEVQQMVMEEQQKIGCRQEHIPSVTTAEKMQGQEFDTIVICYNGWSANIKDSEFIFNRNRLNVSFSRAKQRIVLIISSSLLRPDDKIFNNSKTDNAYKFLIEYIKYSTIHRFNVEKVPATPIVQTIPNTPTTPTTPFGQKEQKTPTTPQSTPTTTTTTTQTTLSPNVDDKSLQKDFIEKLNISYNN